MSHRPLIGKMNVYLCHLITFNSRLYSKLSLQARNVHYSFVWFIKRRDDAISLYLCCVATILVTICVWWLRIHLLWIDCQPYTLTEAMWLTVGECGVWIRLNDLILNVPLSYYIMYIALHPSSGAATNQKRRDGICKGSVCILNNTKHACTRPIIDGIASSTQIHKQPSYTHTATHNTDTTRAFSQYMFDNEG